MAHIAKLIVALLLVQLLIAINRIGSAEAGVSAFKYHANINIVFDFVVLSIKRPKEVLVER